MVNMEVFEESRRHQVVQKYEVYPLNTSDVEDYQIKLAGMASSIKEDARIVQNDLLDQWIELKGNVWSKLDNLKAKTPQIILGLSGNPSSKDTDDGNATFDFFENFENFAPQSFQRYGSNPIVGTGAFDEACKPSVVYTDSEYKMYYYERDNWTIELETSSDGESFVFSASNPMLSGTVATWDSAGAIEPAILYHNSEYWLYYTGHNGDNINRIGLAKSSDGISFTKITNGIGGTSKVLDVTAGWDQRVQPSCVIYHDSKFWLFYHGYDGTNWRIGLATSTDGVNFTRITDGIGGTSKVLDIGTGWENLTVGRCSIFQYNNEWKMYYQGKKTGGSCLNQIGFATSSDLKNWTKYEYNPVLGCGSSSWEQLYVLAPCFIFKANDSSDYGLLYYQGCDNPGLNTIGLTSQIVKGDFTHVETTGGLEKWDVTHTPEIQSIIKYSGTYAIKLNGTSYEMIEKNISSLSRPLAVDFRLKYVAGEMQSRYRTDTPKELPISWHNNNANFETYDGGWQSLGISHDTNWHLGSIRQLSTTVKLYIDGVEGSYFIVDNGNPHKIKFYIVGDATELYLDNIRIRKHDLPEPIISIINNLNRASLIKALGSRL